ncbi:MAG: ABC transporter ATP-binding protein, partial [Mesorhizobium sp.]
MTPRRLTPASRSFTPPSVLPDISPARGEIGCRPGFRQLSTSQKEAGCPKLPISPLAGEMSGRT